MDTIFFEDWGRVAYPEAWEKQKTAFNQAMNNKLQNLPILNRWCFCEHPPVITLGRSGKRQNLLFSQNELEARGVLYQEIDRGGDITFHGPGQMVCYPILNLEAFGLGLRRYIWVLEEIVIQVLSHFGIVGMRFEGATGVWLEVGTPRARKICAIGVKSSRYITMHGLALNVNTKLEYFSLINPCGYTSTGVTSMQQECGHPVDIDQVMKVTKHVANDLLKITKYTKLW